MARPRSDAGERALALVAERGFVRARDFREAGISPRVVAELAEAGKIEPVVRGLYASPEASDPWFDIAVAIARYPAGIIFGQTAATWHGLVGQITGPIWLAMPKGFHLPAELPRGNGTRTIRIRPSWWRGERMAGAVQDIQPLEVAGIPGAITSPALTVVDMFRHRSEVGEAMALEALETAQRDGVDLGNIQDAADRTGMGTVMQPYLAAMRGSLTR